MALIVVGCVVLAACSNGDEPEATDATELDTSATPSESDFAEDADLLTLEFAAVPPGSYRVDSLGTPFSVAIEGDWWVQSNQPAWTVFSAPESQGPSDDDVVFLRPVLLGDPTDPGACCDGTTQWPMDDIQGWLDNIVYGVVVSGPEDVEIVGLPAVTFEVEVTDSAPCGPDCEGEGVTGPPFLRRVHRQQRRRRWERRRQRRPEARHPSFGRVDHAELTAVPGHSEGER